MRIKTKLVTTEVSVYEAFDGKQFDTEEECLKYELEVDKTLQAEKEAEKLIVLYDYASPGSSTYSSDSGLVWYRVNNENEFELLYAAYNEVQEPKEYPAWYCIETICDDYYVFELADSTKYIKEFYNELGFDVTIELRKEVKDDSNM
jgi:hypothetical protein